MKLSTDRLFRRMELEEMTAAQLAEKAGISRQAVYNLVSGKSQPKPETLRSIAEALNCKPDQLLGRDERAIDHTRFADVLVARHIREREAYDVKSAMLEYIRNWAVERYNDLDDEQFKAAKAEAERQGAEFAADVDHLLLDFELLNISDGMQAKVVEEAFVSFFVVLYSMTDLEAVGFNPDLDIFDGIKEFDE